MSAQPGSSKEGGAGAGSNTFAQVSFVSEESGAAVDLDDPNFWTKILPEVGSLADMDPEAAAAMDAAAEASGAAKLRTTRPDHLTALDHLMKKPSDAARKRPREGDATWEQP